MIEWTMCEYESLECLTELFGCVCVTVAWENNGKHWFCRPSERVSPRRD